jgi:phospholipase/carboxylesterase
VASFFPNTTWVLPTAPMTSVTINMGAMMPAWYDITTLGRERKEDKSSLEGLKKSVEFCRELMTELSRFERDLYVGGFSQGGCVALSSVYDKGAPENVKVKGCIALSTYTMMFEPASSNVDVPLLMTHGTDDSVVRFSWGDDSCKQLRIKNVTFKSFDDLGHSVDERVFEAMQEFLDSKK